MKTIAKIFVAAIAYVIGLMVSGMIAAALHLPAPTALDNPHAQAQAFKALLLAAPLLTAGLMPLVLGLRGTWTKRALAVGLLLFVALGLNTVIEARAFSNMIVRAPLMTAFYVLPVLLATVVLTWPAATSQPNPANVVKFTPAAWTSRLLVAWLAFPVIYFVFGMAIAPIVMPYYNAGVAGLKIPPIHIVLGTQLVRSALFLLASLPVLLLWNKSRGQLLLALGLAHAVMVGIFGLVQASFFPMVLRVTHSIEITADSFAYAAVLVLLFARYAKTAEPHSARAAASN